MKIKNYEIKRYNSRNLSVFKTTIKKANPMIAKKLNIANGEMYPSTSRMGFYGSSKLALLAVFNDLSDDEVSRGEIQESLLKMESFKNEIIEAIKSNKCLI